MTTVRVDEDFARFGSKSYAINKINSVDVRVRRPHGILPPVAAGMFAVVALLATLGSLSMPDGSPGGSFVVALALFGLTYWLWQRSKIREYLLFLMTSSSETQAFVTRDEGEVIHLRDEIEAAMLHHSRRGSGNQ